LPALGLAGSAPFTGTLTGVAAVSADQVVVAGYGNGQAQSLVAHLCAFPVTGTGFGTATARLTGTGAAAYWVIPASDTTSHELTDGSGFGQFDSGVKAPGSSYGFTFPAAGTWPVTDASDGAHQQVAVPVLSFTGFTGRTTLWLATAAPPAGARFEMQDIPPGGTKFVHFLNTTNLTWSLGRKLPAGSYEFRSRMRNPATGAATGWSPATTVTLP
jgi:hypothetical protein